MSAEVSSVKLNVTVIGGGIGGLCLAQGLRKNGVDVTVYERGPQVDDVRWQQGFQIHIGPPGAQALQRCLPPGRWEALLERACRPSDGVQVFNHRMKRVALVGSDVMDGRAHVLRSTLRRTLLEGLEDCVRFEKPFVGFQHMPDGRVEVSFDDGSRVVTDVLVGADGISSKVRRQRLPSAHVVDTGVVGASCKLPLDALPPVLRARLSSVVGPAGRYMIVTQAIHGDAYRTHDHAIWVFTCPRAAYGEADPRAMSSEDLRALILSLMKSWDPALRDMVAHPDGHISAVPLLKAAPVDRWTPGKVTLLGDAIHAMPPFGGQGGTSALRDAAMLCARLVDADAQRVPLVDAIGAYEAHMLEHGFRAVQRSARFGAMVSSPHGLTRAVTLLLMRAVSLLPRLRRVLIERRFSQS